MKHLKILPVLIVGGCLLANCGSDDEATLNVPDTYTFERDGVSTVSYNGQTTRIAMAEAIISALKNPSEFDELTIDAMFAHEAGNEDFEDATLNASDKSVRSKTAASEDFFSSNATVAHAIKGDFDDWIAEQTTEVFPVWTNAATNGVAGNIQEAGGGSIRYVNGKGLELDQAFTKGLIGAMMVDQALNNYLGRTVLDAGSNVADNDSETVVEGRSYTNMEHKWDEAYGYVYGGAINGASPLPSGSADSFINKYIGRVEDDSDFAGIDQNIYNAFKRGRAAIVARDYTIRDEQAEIIRDLISQVIGIRAVYYLQQGKAGLEAVTVDYASVFHDLSEGLGFVYSLQFTRKPRTDSPYFTRSEVQTFIDTIYSSGTEENGFWDVTPDDLQFVSESIADEFDFTVDQASM